MFNREVATFPLDEVGFAAPPIHVQERANASRNDRTTRSVVVALVPQPKVVIDSHLQAHELMRIVATRLHCAAMYGVGSN